MIRFYAPDIETDATLPETESGHIVRVLRKQPGDSLEVVDGKGKLFRCTLLDAHPKHAMVQIDSFKSLPKVWKPQITVAVAPTKHLDRMEWLVEKLVEIGIDRFVPILCNRSERKEIKRERLEKIAVSAMKQSLKATLPQIDEMIPIGGFLHQLEDTDSVKYMGYCDDNTPRSLLACDYVPTRDVVILIGPEGDFTDSELKMAVYGTGFIPVSMGDNRLRTETAALVAVSTIHTLNQAANIINPLEL